MSFQPDHIFESTYGITPEFFISNGIKYVISDIDNTLITYDDAGPTQRCRDWIDQMTEAGIKIAFLSNNKNDRVAVFNESLGFSAYAKAGKPFAKKAKMLLAEMGAEKSETCLLGDQLLTDVLCGKSLGVKTVLVSPIKDRTDAFTKFKRKLEKLILVNKSR